MVGKWWKRIAKEDGCVGMEKVKVCGYWRKKTIFAVRTREFL
jgi:hypothetical protein